jgi:hypothetical protein
MNIEISFTPATNAPANGYEFGYRLFDTSDSYNNTTGSSSPITISDIEDGTYDYHMRSLCIENNTVYQTGIFSGDYVGNDLIDYQATNSGLVDGLVQYKNGDLSWSMAAVPFGETISFTSLQGSASASLTLINITEV